MIISFPDSPARPIASAYNLKGRRINRVNPVFSKGKSCIFKSMCGRSPKAKSHAELGLAIPFNLLSPPAIPRPVLTRPATLIFQIPFYSFFIRRVNPVVAKTDMGKPLFKASDGGRVDVLG
jgi:hypothetical protein